MCAIFWDHGWPYTDCFLQLFNNVEGRVPCRETSSKDMGYSAIWSTNCCEHALTYLCVLQLGRGSPALWQTIRIWKVLLNNSRSSLRLCSGSECAHMANTVDVVAACHHIGYAKPRSSVETWVGRRPYGAGSWWNLHYILDIYMADRCGDHYNPIYRSLI